jgi:hypothetical protein
MGKRDLLRRAEAARCVSLDRGVDRGVRDLQDSDRVFLLQNTRMLLGE